jgi:hypothetical protein
MNPNDPMAQQQALLNQILHNTQQWQLAYLAISLAGFIILGWVVYMFYARLRDIADELRKIRVTYEMEQDRTIRVAARATSAPVSDTPGIGDLPYMPKG